VSDTPNADVRTYRPPLAGAVAMFVCAAVFVALAGVGVYAYVTEGSALSLVLAGGGFLAGAAFSAWVGAEIALQRVEVGYDWIRVRTVRGTRRVAFAEIAGFAEIRGILRLGPHVSEFRIFTTDEGPPLTFTSQVEGWAAIVQALHENVPWRVPPAAALAARRAVNAGLFDPISAAIAAPGQPIPEERDRPGRVRWRDALLAQVLAFAIALPSVIVVINWVQARIGRHVWLDFLGIVVANVALQLLALLITRWMRDFRLRRAQRHARRRLEDADALERQSPSRVKPPDPRR
jgi:hypothetical protein